MNSHRIALGAAGLSVVAMILAIVAISRDPKCPRCDVPEPAPASPRAGAPERAVPEPAFAPEPMPMPAPTPVPPTVWAEPAPDRSGTEGEKVADYRWLADELGRALVAFAAKYPAKLPTEKRHAEIWPSIYIPDRVWSLDAEMALPDRSPSIPALDEPARRLLAHLEVWAPRWFEHRRYYDRGDYLDDGGAAGQLAAPDIRASLALAIEHARALAAAVEAPWRAEVEALAARAPDSDRAIVDVAYEACRAAIGLALDHDPVDKKALGDATTRCRDATDTVRRRGMDYPYAGSLVSDLDNLSAALAGFRRDERQRDDVLFWAVNVVESVSMVRRNASEAQAEAAP